LTADTTTGYGNNQSVTDVVKIEGAQSLEVTITCQTESTSYDWVCVYDGSVTPSSSNYGSSISGKLGGTTKTTETFIVPGDTVQFFLRSDSSQCSYYGYYATVKAGPSGTYEEPTNGENFFKGWYTDRACTDGNEFDQSSASSLTTHTTVYAKWSLFPDPIMMAYTSDYTGDYHAYNSTVTKVSFEDEYALPEGFDTTAGYGPWDVSEAQNGSVMAYMVGTEVFICSNVGEAAKVIANEDSSNIFYKFSKVTEIDCAKFDTSPARTMNFMFYNCTSITTLDLSGFNTSNVTNMSDMFHNCVSLTSLDVSSWETGNVTDMYRLFFVCRSLKGLDVVNWDTSNVTNMAQMFNTCNRLTSSGINGISSWNTSNVISMDGMFADCGSLTVLDLEDWDTSNVTSMGAMFYWCSSLNTLEISSWDTSKVRSMTNMFRECYDLETLDVGGWKTGKVYDMSGMFGNCYSLKSLDVSGWDTSNVEYMYDMFYSCSGLTALDVSSWNTVNVEYMYSMFHHCSNLTELDLSSWDTSIVTDMSDMFGHCYAITTIYASELWSTDKVSSSSGMFTSCSELKGDIAYNSNSSYSDKTYAKTSGGYLTYKAAPASVAEIAMLNLDANGGTTATQTYRMEEFTVVE
jgi:uncharacterized repeat protein (TIGR02543 family)